MQYPGHSLVGGGGLTHLPISSWCILQPQPSGCLVIVFHWRLWVTASLLNSPGLFPRLSPTSTKLLCGCYRLVLPISNFSSPLIKPLWIVPSAPVIIFITVSFMFHSFFSSLARSKIFFFFVFFNLHSVVGRESKIHNSVCFLLFSLVFKLWLSQVFWPSLVDLFVFWNPREFCKSHFLDRFRFARITFSSVVKF